MISGFLNIIQEKMKKNIQLLNLRHSNWLLAVFVFSMVIWAGTLTAKADTDYSFKYTSDGTSITITGFSTVGSGGTYIIPDTIKGLPVTAIADEAFKNKSNIVSISIPDSVKTIGNNAFRNCDNMTGITIGNSVTTIGNYAFASCDKLASVTPGASVQTIGDHAFYECGLLENFTGDNSLQTIGSYAFRCCYKLATVTLGNSLQTIGSYAFSNCKALKEITLPDSLTEIGACAFSYCSDLKEITLPDSLTSVGNCVFSACTSLEKATIKSTTSGKNDMSSMFADCTNLTTVIFSDTVTIIKPGMFMYCTGLTSVTFPASLTTIDDRAFENCTSLETVDLLKTDKITSIGIYAFSGCSNLTIYAPQGSYAETFAKSYGIQYSNCFHATETSIVVASPTCTEPGTRKYECAECHKLLREEEIPATGHSMADNLVKATLTKNGYMNRICKNCETSTKKTVIYYPKKFVLSSTSYVYNGSVRTPSLKVYGSDGKLISSSNYKITYPSGRKNVGTYTYKITFKGNYSGTKNLSFTIYPKGTTITSLTAAGKTLTIKWKKQSAQTNGYQIRYTTGNSTKTVTVAKNNAVSKKVKALKAYTIHKVQVRTYKKVNGKMYYSSWSKAKKVKSK